MKDQNGKFLGFNSPRYTQVPDELFDELLAELSGSELKVLLYVVRRTFGFKRDSDHISLSQMVRGITKKDGSVLDRGTGLHKDSVVKAVRTLVHKGILLQNKFVSAEKGYEASEYALKILDHPLSENPTREPDGNNRQGLVRISDIQETGKQEILETLDKNPNAQPVDKQVVDNSNDAQDQALLGEILAICQDPKSAPYYRQVIRALPRPMVLGMLSQVREAKALGRIKASPGAMFTDLVKRRLADR